MLLSHLYKLDNVHSPFSLCLEEQIESCKEMQEVDHKAHIICVFGGFNNCMSLIHQHDPLYERILEGTATCFQKHGTNMLCGRVFIQRYQEHVKNS